ncbi:glutathione S-transferase family protein [Bdellovibrio bacteriovorus]|uniref:glutathione S-transferase family protein n=1 Tax=Bdellovibrio bacteriovorus TaxID=959 RepID=UPI0035A6AF77
MIKIYGSPMSSAGRCYWMLEELGVPYEAMPLNMGEKEHKSEAFLKLNPNGKIPVIVDGDFVLWESMAITNYLAKKFESPLAAKNLQEESLIQQWSLWGLIDFQEPAVNWMIQELFVPAEHRNHQIIENAKKALPRVLEVLNRGLEGKTYLVGNRFTVADVNVGAVTNILLGLKYDLKAYPNVQKWMGEFQQRTAFKKVAEMRHFPK